MAKSIAELITKINRWADERNLKQADPKIQWMRITEEVGEIRDVLLKPTKFTQPQAARWMNWGTMSNGKCLTAKISESRKIENGSILSDILEEQAGEKYFLSLEQDQINQLSN